MKVALLSDCYLPRLGGIEVQVHDLAGHLRAAGHEVEVFTATRSADGLAGGRVEDVDGVPVHRFAMRFKAPLDAPVNPFAPGEVRARLAAGGFDVAHVHIGVVSPFAQDMVGVGLGLGMPTAVTWHSMLDKVTPLWRRLGFVARWSMRGAALSAVSAQAAREVRAAGASEVAVLGNGIDVATWAPTNARVRPADEFLVTSALRMAKRKRPGAVVDVMGAARRAIPDSTRVVAQVFGDGPRRPVLEREIQRRGLEGAVMLRGRVGREVLAQAHHDSDAYLSTATLESFGIAALEARTAGLPIVGRRGTGIEDFVRHEVEGLLADDDAGLAAALTRLATDSGLQRSIAEHNATVAPEQAWPTMVERTVAEYRRAAELAR